MRVMYEVSLREEHSLLIEVDVDKAVRRIVAKSCVGCLVILWHVRLQNAAKFLKPARSGAFVLFWRKRFSFQKGGEFVARRLMT